MLNFIELFENALYKNFLLLLLLLLLLKLLKTLMVGHGGSSAGSYLTNPTSPPTVHQLLRLALYELMCLFCVSPEMVSASSLALPVQT